MIRRGLGRLEGSAQLNVLICRRSPVEALNGLLGQLGDHVEVSVEVEDGSARQFRGGCDQQVGNGRPPMVTALGQ